MLQIYAVVAAWRDLVPGARWRTLLAFQPQQRTEYLEILTIKCVLDSFAGSLVITIKWVFKGH
jgi:hypothetical protein